MLKAEEVLRHAVEAAPEDLTARVDSERALRLHRHALWLAHRGYARAAERRFREAAGAQERSGSWSSASQAFGRLGYYLWKWQRPEEALEALRRAESLAMSGNVGPVSFLRGLLERHAAIHVGDGANMDLIHDAEETIMMAGELEKSDLEAERQRVVAEITFWRNAHRSPTSCLGAEDPVRGLICLVAHVGLAVQEAFFAGS